MPFEKLVVGDGRAWGIWRIAESEDNILEALPYPEELPTWMTHPQKRLEYLTGRLVTARLLSEFNMIYNGMIKDEYGKPFLVGHQFHVSLSHSYPYVAVILDAAGPVGIDLEQPKDKLLRIGPRVLSPNELNDAGGDVVKHCIYWCAKETLIKIHGKKGLHLSSHINISPFSRLNEGNIVGRLIVDGITTVLPLYYLVNNDYVLVCNSRTT